MDDLARDNMSSATHPDVPPFPPASTFSILPEIYLVIARLNILHPSSATAQQQSQSQTQTQSQSQPLPPPPPPPPPLQSQISATSTASHQTGPLLDAKDLPSQIYPPKQRLARARAAVSALPDVQRSVEEQEKEIRELEAQVRGLKARIGGLAKIAASEQTLWKSEHEHAHAHDGGEEGEKQLEKEQEEVKEDVVMQSAEG